MRLGLQWSDSGLEFDSESCDSSPHLWGFSSRWRVRGSAEVCWALNMYLIIFPSCWPGSTGVDSDVDSLWLQPAASDRGHRSGCADGSGSQLWPHSCSFLHCAARADEGTGWAFKSDVNLLITYGGESKWHSILYPVIPFYWPFHNPLKVRSQSWELRFFTKVEKWKTTKTLKTNDTLELFQAEKSKKKVPGKNLTYVCVSLLSFCFIVLFQWGGFPSAVKGLVSLPDPSRPPQNRKSSTSASSCWITVNRKSWQRALE